MKARAIRSSEVLFGAEIDDLPASDILDIFDDVPSSRLDRRTLEGDGLPLVELLVQSGLETSKGAARRLLRDGGAYVNNRQVADERYRVKTDELLEGKLLVLRKGRKKYHVLTASGEVAND